MITFNSFSNILIYISTLLFFFMGNSLISIWIFMEINLLFFLFMLYKLEDDNYTMIFKLSTFYFLIQSLGSIFFLLYIFLNDWNFTLFNQDLFLSLALSLKIGLFPFHFWVFQLVPFLNSLSFFFILTFQKIPYFFVFFTVCPDPEILCFFSFLVGNLLLFFNRSLDSMLISSSIASVIWVFLLFSESQFSFFLFFFFYSFCLLPILYYKTTWRGLSLGSSYFFFSISVLFMFMLGLPPLSLFMFKIDVMNFILFNHKDFIMFSLFFFSMLSLSGYFKTFFKNLVFLKYLYSLNRKETFFSLFGFFYIIPFIFFLV